MSSLRATYRLQLGPDLDLAGVRALLPYLDALGISHLSLSPVWDHGAAAVAPELGGEQALRDLAAAARERAMGLVLDALPDPAPAAPALRAKLSELIRDGVADARSGADPGDDAFCADLQALFIDPAGEAPLTELWQEVRGASQEVPLASPRSLRLLALDEVGAAPGRFGMPVQDFHAANVARAERFPQNRLITTTHETRRSGDVRARLGALAAIGAEWAGAVRRWRADNAALRIRPGVPTDAEELLIYQTLIGAWPIDEQRLADALTQAIRVPAPGGLDATIDDAHVEAVSAFARALLAHGPFRYGFDGWAARVADMGARATLGQVLLKLTCPGVPVIHQGDELELLALGDPDNRRPIDWAARAAALRGLTTAGAPPREHAKLHLIWRALQLRAELPDAFTGSYTPIPAGDGVCAFLRGTDVIVVAAVRDAVTGASGWALPPEAAGRWRDVLGGADHDLPGGASLAAVMGPEGRALLRRVD